MPDNNELDYSLKIVLTALFDLIFLTYRGGLSGFLWMGGGSTGYSSVAGMGF